MPGVERVNRIGNNLWYLHPDALPDLCLGIYLIVWNDICFQGVKDIKQEIDETTLHRARIYRPPGEADMISKYFHLM
jgi:hypothetical protein